MVGALVWQYQQRQQGTGVVRTLACPNLAQGCSMQVDGHPFSVSITGELKPLQAFQVHVTSPNTEKVTAHFSMEGMDMGFNLYTFKKDPSGIWQARVTLPVCVTGRRDWAMHLDMESTQTRTQIRVPFVTDL
jgi:hypothetical protein